MGAHKVSRNAICPCESGRKYKHCCLDKKFEWTVADHGLIMRSIPISEELKPVLAQQIERFVTRHGREPGPNEPLFPELAEENLCKTLVNAMERVNMRPEIIYAYKKTGLLVTEFNRDYIPENDIDEFEYAIEEYRRSAGSGNDD